MSETPRTDAHMMGGSYSFDMEFARQLERELNEVREANRIICERESDLIAKLCYHRDERDEALRALKAMADRFIRFSDGCVKDALDVLAKHKSQQA